jgi:hypothetical protein
MNSFLDTVLSKEEYEKFVIAMYHSKQLMNSLREGRATILDTLANINDVIFSMFRETDLVPKLEKFVANSGIDTPVLKDIGSRPQDTREMTFVKEDYECIYNLIFVCKMLFPLFGELISIVKNDDSFNSELKEKYCLGLFTAVRDVYFSYISEKLINYIANTIGRKTNSSDLMIGFYGYSIDGLVTDLFASMLVKKFVNTNLFEKQSDIMKFIYTCIKRSINSKYGKFMKDGKIFVRFDPADKFEDEDNKVSFLENIGIPSKVTSDIPIIVKIGIAKYVKDYIKAGNIDKAKFDVAVAFYSDYSIPISPINEFLLSLFVGDEIGGAIGMMYADFDDLIRLAVIVQDYFVKNGFVSLVPLLTMVNTDTVRGEPDAVTNSILIKKGMSLYQKNCIAEYSHLGDSFGWEGHFNDMINYLVRELHRFVVAPVFLEDGDFGDNKNGEIYKFEENIIEEIYRFTITEIFRRKPDVY